MYIKMRRKGDMGNTHFHKRHFSIPMQHFSFVKTRVTFNRDGTKMPCGELAAAVGPQAGLTPAPAQRPAAGLLPAVHLQLPLPGRRPGGLWARLLFGK